MLCVDTMILCLIDPLFFGLQPMEHKPVPLATGEEAEYMQALKQEFRGAMKTLPFFIRPAAPKTGRHTYR